MSRDGESGGKRREASRRALASYHFKRMCMETGVTSCEVCEWEPAHISGRWGKRIEGLDVHHLTPRSAGGSHDFENLVLLCPNCHRETEMIWGRTQQFNVVFPTKGELIKNLRLLHSDPDKWQKDRDDEIRSKLPPAPWSK